jgi:hypothetical protein
VTWRRYGFAVASPKLCLKSLIVHAPPFGWQAAAEDEDAFLDVATNCSRLSQAYALLSDPTRAIEENERMAVSMAHHKPYVRVEGGPRPSSPLVHAHT